jgi:hypothetical protein
MEDGEGREEEAYCSLLATRGHFEKSQTPKALRANVQISKVQTPKKSQPEKLQRPPELLTVVI